MASKRPRVTLTPEQEVNFKERYNNGASLKTLSEEIDCSLPTMRRKLADLGCKIKPQGRPKPVKEVVEAARELEEMEKVNEALPLPVEPKSDKRFEW